MPLVPGLADAVPTQRQPTDWRTPAAPRAIVEPCVCGHARAAHDHYRAGTDCGACGAAGCESYQPAEPARKSVLKALFGR